jgi:cyanate lyase
MNQELPYGGPSNPNSGYAGSDTSRERAEREDSDGTTSFRQQQVTEYLIEQRERGGTWADVADALGLHHGAASGVLSVLHKTGHIARLAHKRGRSKVYVMPEFVNERATEEPGKTSRSALTDDLASMLRRIKITGRLPAAFEMDEVLERYNRARR